MVFFATSLKVKFTNTSWRLDPPYDYGSRGVAVGPKGNVYVSGGGRLNITIFDPDGGFINSWNVGYYVFGIAVDSSGYIYASECSGDGELPHIGKYDFNGTLLVYWGAEGSEDGNFSAGANGIAVDSGSFVYASDTGNHRIQKFAMQTLIPDILKDSDGDGLTDLNEMIGWNVTFTNATGTYTIRVSSEPLMNDTDLEGLTD